MSYSLDTFVSDDFQPTAFIRSQREYADLEAIARGLDDVMASLQSDLVDLIHRDFDSFMRLTSDLKSTHYEVDAVQGRVANARELIQVLRDAIARKVAAVEAMHAQDVALGERRRALHARLAFLLGLERAERLLSAAGDGP
eukprot:CAMPEP_0206014132 /NCGR_PEP_ID=MMETSP1464-20131121/17744_1 /ASSEMBLY_ACC=CAM_ASM_001124 /TAXON_ID=119497 /ORGANISM="Exanthemachrysis gayraliae, Strain RCC1523" /LENGTH=140 /DNA_ID=CAMNT_0053387877 /DNA_START=35 /DNA_END=453 /DNA_ORIENTATION=+